MMNEPTAEHGVIGITPRGVLSGAARSGAAVDENASLRADSHLVRQAQDGSLAAFEVLVRRYQPRLASFLAPMVGYRAHDVDDLVQETFLRAYRHLGRYRARWAFSTWLFSIAMRLAIDMHRKRRPDPAGELPILAQTLASDAPAPDAAAVRREQRDRIWDVARQSLSQDHVAMLWLSYVEQMSTQQIGQVMGKSGVAVKIAMHRARRRLAQRLLDSGLVENEGNG